MKKILVIDDDLPLRIMLRLMLESMGFSVSEASDGREGIAAFKDGGADIVMTDLVMPEKEGFETIQELRKANPNLVIIAMTGGGRTNPWDTLKIAKHLGATRVLAKPFSGAELAEAVHGEATPGPDGPPRA
jgi:DNA-binding response OmpR family regulator